MYSTIEVDFSIFNSAWWIMIPLIYIYIIDAVKFSVNGIVFHNAKTFAVILLFIGYLSVNISANFCWLKMLSTKKRKDLPFLDIILLMSASFFQIESLL
jgi:hypothetical protein